MKKILLLILLLSSILITNCKYKKWFDPDTKSEIKIISLKKEASLTKNVKISIELEHNRCDKIEIYINKKLIYQNNSAYNYNNTSTTYDINDSNLLQLNIEAKCIFDNSIKDEDSVKMDLY